MFIAILLLVVGLICILHGVRLLIRRRRNKAIMEANPYYKKDDRISYRYGQASRRARRHH